MLLLGFRLSLQENLPCLALGWLRRLADHTALPDAGIIENFVREPHNGRP